jgi:multisubunit Na+/H+ antiporter MnhC subunit
MRLRSIVFKSTLPLDEALRRDVKPEIAEIVIQGSITILCTVLISLYLIFNQRQQRKLIGMENNTNWGKTNAKNFAGKAQGSDGYMTIVAMLIESYALESVWLLTSVIISKQAASLFFLGSVPYIEVSLP